MPILTISDLTNNNYFLHLKERFFSTKYDGTNTLYADFHRMLFVKNNSHLSLYREKYPQSKEKPSPKTYLSRKIIQGTLHINDQQMKRLEKNHIQGVGMVEMFLGALFLQNLPLKQKINGATIFLVGFRKQNYFEVNGEIYGEECFYISHCVNGETQERYKLNGFIKMLVKADGDKTEFKQLSIHSNDKTQEQFLVNCFTKPPHQIEATGSVFERIVDPDELKIAQFAETLSPSPSQSSVSLTQKPNGDIRLVVREEIQEEIIMGHKKAIPIDAYFIARESFFNKWALVITIFTLGFGLPLYYLYHAHVHNKAMRELSEYVNNPVVENNSTPMPLASTPASKKEDNYPCFPFIFSLKRKRDSSEELPELLTKSVIEQMQQFN